VHNERLLFGSAGKNQPVIDLHCHILPALDDGAIDLADSVAMARQAEADGIQVVAATPHIRSDHDVNVDQLESRIEAVNAELQRQDIDVLVAHGGEVADEALHEVPDSKLRRVSLGATGVWLLIEPRPGPITGDLIETVDQLADRDFRCVIAHPERHAGGDFRERLQALVERGALIQVTAALIADGPASPTLIELAAEGLVHLLGSDSHSSHAGRPVQLSHGLARLAEVDRVKPHLDWVVREGPRAILAGEEATPPFLPGLDG
jgi:protein-tyrosine phosphatase